MNRLHQKSITIVLITVLLFILSPTAQSEAMNTDAEGHIPYTVNNLTDGTRMDVYPEFSMDGKQIVFSSKPIHAHHDEAPIHLWIMDSDGKNRREITSGKGRDLFPTFTHDGEKIIFVSDRRDGLWDIWSVKVDGSHLARLKEMNHMESSPFVTADGKNILFISKAGAKETSVWTMGIDGSNPKRLTSGGNGDFFPSMGSENSKEIIFSSTRVGKGDVWSIDTGKNVYKRLTYKNVTEGSPALSKDWTKIAYRSQDGGIYDSFNTFDMQDYSIRYNAKLPEGQGVYDIWLMNRDGTNKRRLTRGMPQRKKSHNRSWAPKQWALNLHQFMSYYHISWHPDGNKIALTTWNPGEKGSSISTVEFDSKKIDALQGEKELLPEYNLIGEKEITKGDWDDFAPGFSPDGKALIFSSDKSGNWDIWRINNLESVISSQGSALDPEKLEQLTNSPADEVAPVFSPDSKKIAYLSRPATRNYSLWIMDRDGSQARQVTNDIPVNSYPAWSPDGKEIIFVSENRDGPEIWTHHVADHTQKKIAAIWKKGKEAESSKQKAQGGRKDYPFREFLYRVDYNAVGDRIVFESNRSGNIDIWRMDITGKNLFRITKGNLPHWNPVFSPDGKKIIYSAERPVPRRVTNTWPDYNIWIADAETGKKMVLTGEEQLDWNPVWSPDGKKIAYVTNRSGNFDHFSIWMLYLK